MADYGFRVFGSSHETLYDSTKDTLCVASDGLITVTANYAAKNEYLFANISLPIPSNLTKAKIVYPIITSAEHILRNKSSKKCPAVIFKQWDFLEWSGSTFNRANRSVSFSTIDGGERGVLCKFNYYRNGNNLNLVFVEDRYRAGEVVTAVKISAYIGACI